MKSKLTIILLLFFFHSAQAQKQCYNQNGKYKKYEKEQTDIIFFQDSIKLIYVEKTGAEAVVIGAALTTFAIEGIFKLTTKYFENNVKKFTTEYTRSKHDLKAISFNKNVIRNFSFFRNVSFNNSTPTDTALKIIFKAESTEIDEKICGFTYYVESIYLKYTSAKATKSKNDMDYLIEVYPVLLINGELKKLDAQVISINGVDFGTKSFGKEYNTGLMLFPKDATFIGVELKIIETNPAKVRAEKILSLWNDNNENIKTVINNIITPE